MGVEQFVNESEDPVHNEDGDRLLNRSEIEMVRSICNIYMKLKELGQHIVFEPQTMKSTQLIWSLLNMSSSIGRTASVMMSNFPEMILDPQIQSRVVQYSDTKHFFEVYFKAMSQLPATTERRLCVIRIRETLMTRALDRNEFAMGY